jgi:hypothetical protein
MADRKLVLRRPDRVGKKRWYLVHKKTLAHGQKARFSRRELRRLLVVTER